MTTQASRFRHEAFVYRSDGQFLDVTSAFIAEGVDAGQPVMVAVSAPKIEALKMTLGSDASRVGFVDMVELGQNPGRIIPAWQEFLDEHGRNGVTPRGIGEPVWPERGEAELAECHHHEALLNVAFDVQQPWWLLCPYDESALAAVALESALRTHPHVLDGAEPRASDRYDVERVVPADPLPEPAGPVKTRTFGRDDLHVVRDVVGTHAAGVGLDRARTQDLVLAVNELMTNSLRYGGGHGDLRLWSDATSVQCEVRDHGRIDEPLIGRLQPGTRGASGRGLWIVNEICDLVQLRSSDAGTVVRLHMFLG